MSLRLYFDNNVYNRPFDDRTIGRNREEAAAVWVLLGMVEVGEAELVSSFVVEREHSRLDIAVRRRAVHGLISMAQGYVESAPTIFERASRLEMAGMSVNDALHLAAAEHATVDYFVTCDDKLSNQSRRMQTPLKVILPTELVEREGL